MSNYIIQNGVLYHSGVKGQKWGVRRYQNKDGTLTPAGKKRYARDAREKEYNKYDDEQGVYYKQSKKNGRSDLTVDTSRYVKEDMQRSQRLFDAGGRLTNDLKRANDIAIKNKNQNRPKMDLSNMSDKEMRDAINRKMLENQYENMFNPQTTSKGKERTSQILETTGAILGVTSSALGIALAIKELRG